MKRLAPPHSVHLLQSYTMWGRGCAFHTCDVACTYTHSFQILETSLLHLAFTTLAMTL